MLEWFVVIAKQNQDHLAAKGLREQGFADVYLPKTFERRRTDKGNKPVGSLLLSPYLFVLFDAQREEHGPIKNTRGVQELLCDPGSPTSRPMPLRGGARLIARLRQAEDEELCTAAINAKMGRTDLKRGMIVRIDKPGISRRGPDGDATPIEGKIMFLDRRKVELLSGVFTFIVDEDDVSEVA